MRSALRWWRRLHVRLALLVVLCLGSLGVGLSAWTERSMQRWYDADLQMRSLRLARYIADRQPEPLIDAQGRPHPTLLARTAMYASEIHPSLEIYLLGRDGQILQHTLGTVGPQRDRVDLAPLAPLLGDTSPVLPIYGDDPRRPGAPNLASIAALPGDSDVQGYLYVVLRGRMAQQTQQQALAERQRDATWRVIVLSLALASLVIVAAQTGITRRLRTLALSLESFHQPEHRAEVGNRQARDEIDQVSIAAQTLRQRVIEQFRRLQEAERVRLELISNISHDLHTPLANIQGYVETMLVRGDHLTADEREQHLRTSLRHCRSLSRRVAELFELSKLEAGRVQFSAEPFRMAELLNDIVQNYALNAQSRGITLCLAADTDRRVQVLADIALIERVLQNLVDNALRHTPRHGRVEMTVQAQGAQVIVRVRDNGHGIAAPDLPYVFERYWTTGVAPAAAEQLEPSQTSVGLGLAIARRIIELHGGRIDVRSTPKQGTEFYFSLPAQPG